MDMQDSPWRVESQLNKYLAESNLMKRMVETGYAAG